MLDRDVAAKAKTNTWFLAQVKPNCEALAQRNLARQGFEAFLPQEEVTREMRGRFVTKLRPVFPGYIFVAFDPERGHWRSINGTYGIARLVSFGSQPAAVPTGLVDQLKSRCTDGGLLIPMEKIHAGDQVMLTKGPFHNLIAEVEELTPDRRVWVLLDVMGGERRVSVDLTELRGA